jgi:hypothetical protein
VSLRRRKLQGDLRMGGMPALRLLSTINSDYSFARSW